MPTCINCNGTNIQPTAKYGRQLAGWAQCAEGTQLTIPMNLAIDTCQGCQAMNPNEEQKQALAIFEKKQVGAAVFPIL